MRNSVCPGQRQQILVACDQQAGLTAMGQIEKWLVLRVAANQRRWFHNFNDFAKSDVVCQGVQLFACGKLELRVCEHFRQLVRCYG